MHTVAQRSKALPRTMMAAPMKAGRTLQVLPRTETKEREDGLHSGNSFRGAHRFSEIRVLPPSGPVRDRDTGAALEGDDVEAEPQPGGRQEAEPLQGGGEQPPKSEKPAEGDKAPESEGESEKKGEGESEGCAKPSDHAGILALLDKAGAPKPGKTLAYGFTFWAASGITYPKVEFDWAQSGKQWTGTVKKTAAGMGPVEALYLKPGTYEAREKITAHGQNCGASGKQVPFFSKVGKDISALAKTAEQEHCDDFTRAFDLSYGKWAGIINSIAGTAFGPGTKDQVKAKADKALKAKGDKGRTEWIKEAGRLKLLSLERDKGDHSMKPDGEPKTLDDACTRVDGVSVKGPNTKIPGPSSATLIK